MADSKMPKSLKIWKFEFMILYNKGNSADMVKQKDSGMKRLASECTESHEPLKQRICYLAVVSGSDVMMEVGQRDVS